MAQSRSKLDAVLKHRRHREEEIQQEFAKAKGELMAQEEKLRKLRQRLQEALRDLSEKQARGFSADEMDLYNRFIKRQYTEMQAQQETVVEMEERYEANRELLSQAVREKKIVEKFQETNYKIFLQDSNKKEQGLLDEIAGKQKKRQP